MKLNVARELRMDGGTLSTLLALFFYIASFVMISLLLLGCSGLE